MQGDIKRKRLYTASPIQKPRDEAKMNILELFTEQQLDILNKNGRERKWKNSVPAALLFTKNSGTIFLLTEMYENEPNFAYGLTDQMGSPSLGVIDLKKVSETANIKGDFLLSRIAFEGKYPLAVYAKVADGVGRITTGDNELGYKKEFEIAARGKNLDTSQDLQRFQRVFVWL